MLGDWPEVILKYAVGDFTADLTTIAHRVPPVQPGPNSRVIYLPRDFLQVVVRSLRLNQLRHRVLAGH